MVRHVLITWLRNLFPNNKIINQHIFSIHFNMKKTEKDWKPYALFLSNELDAEKAATDEAISQNPLFLKKNEHKMPQNDSLTKKQPLKTPQFDSVKAFKKLDEKIKKLS